MPSVQVYSDLPALCKDIDFGLDFGLEFEFGFEFGLEFDFLRLF